MEGGDVEIKHTPTPIYLSSTQDGVYIIRLQDQGRELAEINLSGQKVGFETSPREWGEHLVRACNAHDELVAALKAMKEHGIRAARGHIQPGSLIAKQVDAALAKAELA
jgi:hypothetical protein